MFGELEFYAAFDAVLGELAEEIAWRYEGGDIIGGRAFNKKLGTRRGPAGRGWLSALRCRRRPYLSLPSPTELSRLMVSSEISSDFIKLAPVLVDDLASKIDLHYDDEEILEAAEAIAKLQKLQGFIADVPSETFAHIVDRFQRSGGF